MDELSQLDPTSIEDMHNQHQRYRQRAGTQDAVRLPNTHDMPRSNATPEQWEAFHQSKLGPGGFNPLTITTRPHHE